MQHIMAETCLRWFSFSEPDLGNTIPIKDKSDQDLQTPVNKKALEGFCQGRGDYYETLPSLNCRQAPASQPRSWVRCSQSPRLQLFLLVFQCLVNITSQTLNNSGSDDLRLQGKESMGQCFFRDSSIEPCLRKERVILLCFTSVSNKHLGELVKLL